MDCKMAFNKLHPLPYALLTWSIDRGKPSMSIMGLEAEIMAFFISVMDSWEHREQGQGQKR